MVANDTFIRLGSYHKIVINGLVGLLFLTAFGEMIAASNAVVFWTSFAAFVIFLLRAVPLVLLAPRYGLFHPIILSSLYWLCRSLPSSLSESYRTLRFGSGEFVVGAHDALVGWSGEDLSWLVCYSLILTILGIVFYYAGFFFGPGIKLPSFKVGNHEGLKQKVFITCLFSSAVFLYYIGSRGGLDSHLLSWGEGRFAALAGDGFYLHLISLSSLAVLIWLGADTKAYKNLFFWSIVFVSLGMKFIATGSRSQVIYWLGMGVLIWMLRERKIVPWKVLGIIVGSVILMGMLGNFRAVVRDEGQINWNILTDISAGVDKVFGIDDEQGELVARGGKQSGILPILAYVPDEEGLLYGKSYLSILALPIPRALWAEKPRTIGALVNETFFDYDTQFAIPPGAVGEAYWNFYIPGVVVVFFLFGIFHQALCRWFKESEASSGRVVIYVLTLFILSSPSGLSIINWLFAIVPLVILLRLYGLIKSHGN